MNNHERLLKLTLRVLYDLFQALKYEAQVPSTLLKSVFGTKYYIHYNSLPKGGRIMWKNLEFALLPEGAQLCGHFRKAERKGDHGQKVITQE